MNLEEDERFMCLAAPFDDSRIVRGTKISIKSSCAFNRSDVPSKNYILPFGSSKLPTLACWSGKKVGKVQSKPALCKQLWYHMLLIKVFFAC